MRHGMRPTVSPRLQARILFVRECPAFFIASWLPLCLPPPHPQKEADWSCSRGKVTDDERDFQRVGSRARSRPPALFLILFSNLFKNPSVRPLFHRRFSPALGGGGGSQRVAAAALGAGLRSGGGVKPCTMCQRFVTGPKTTNNHRRLQTSCSSAERLCLCPVGGAREACESNPPASCWEGSLIPFKNGRKHF